MSRAQFGTSTQSWQKVCQILETARLARANNRNVPFLRYLNGIVLLGRNLVCTPNGGVTAYNAKAGQNSLLLLSDLLELDSRDPEEEKLISSLLQLASNMSNEITTSLVMFSETPLQLLLDNCSSKSLTSFNKLLSDTNYANPTLQFIESSVKLMDRGVSFFAESEQGRPLFIELLTKTEEWYSDENTFFSKLLNSVISQVLLADCGPLFLDTFKEPLIDEDQRLSLLKVIDAALESLLAKKSVLSCDSLLRIFYHEFTVASAQAIPFIRAADTGPEYSAGLLSQLRNIWNKLVITLDIIQSILEHNPALKSEILKTDVVEELVKLIGEAQKSLPRRSKLADVRNAASKSTTSSEVISDQDELRPEDFPLIKGKIIYLLGILVEKNRTVQDKIRQLQGLEVVLSNCIIDLNNPFIRERSIVCLRYILDGNAENQEFVAKMEAKETVSEDALHEAGYETELINGKVALKRRP